MNFNINSFCRGNFSPAKAYQKGEIHMEKNKIIWKDKNGLCRCQSCGKSVPKNKLHWEKYLGYCDKCYKEIQDYNRKNSKSAN
jgi:Zn finger protein HypA/HybF involved in hydrogenase expression